MHAQSILAAPVAIELPIGSVFPPVRQQLRLVPCGMDCLPNEHRNFIYAIPRHSRHAGGFLFKTSDNGLIKKKKHFGNIPHYRAFQIIREHRPEGVAAPLRECCCSYEMKFMDGSHVVQSPQVSRRPCIGSPSGLGRTEALLFLRNARAILLGLHRLGARRLRSVCQDRSAAYSFDQMSGTQDWPSIRTRRGDGFVKAN